MNFNNLYYFTVLASFQHYRKASEYLCISPPSLNHAISSLEREYGVKLFEKDGRHIKLSKYGEYLNYYTSKGFASITQGSHLLNQFSQKDAGFVDMSFLFVLGYQFVPDLICRFQKEKNCQNIIINLKQSSTKDSIRDLKNGSIDISLCAYTRNEPQILFTPILRQELVLIVSCSHPLAQFEQIDLQQLLSFPMIKYTDNVGEIQELIDQMFQPFRRTPKTFNYLNEEITIAGFISSGINNCIAIVPNLPLLDSFPLKKLKINHKNAFRNIYIANDSKRPMPNCVKVFYEFLKSMSKF